MKQRHRTEVLQILLIEDNPEDARLFKELVREGGQAGEVHWEEDLASGLSAVEEHHPDVIAVDPGLPDSEGVPTIEQIVRSVPELPIVVLTGQQSGDLVLSALDVGATEYLRKDELTPSLLGRTLRWAAERKSMEQALKERERDLRSITENISEGIYRSVPGEGLVYVNRAFADLFGYESPEEITSVDPVELYVRPERREELQDILRREGSFQNEEVECRRKDGTTFTALQSGSVVRDEAGEIISFDGAVTDITERRDAQRKREESEKRIRSVLDALAANVAVLDEKGTIIDVNQKWEQFARENEGDLGAVGVGTNYLASCAPAGEADHSAIPAVREEIRAVIEGERELFEYQYPCHGPDEERWFLLRATPLDRAEGGAVVAHIDVTERVQAVRKQRVLSAAVEQSQEAMVITQAEPIDEPGPEIVYVNSAVEDMTGYAEEELLGQTPRILQGPDTERDVLDSLSEALEAEEEWTGETINYRKDGTPYRVQWSLAPVRGEDGEVEHWVSVQRDVTEERKREKQMTQMAQALDQVGDKVFITDREGRIQYVNEAFKEVTGYTEEEVVGKTPAVLQSGEHDEAFYEELWETVLSGESFRAEFVNEKKNGTRYVEDEHISPVTDEEGDITHFVSAGRDVTERKEREEALRQHRNLLQQAQRLAGAWEVDLQAGALTWSDKVYRIHEMEPGTEIEIEDGLKHCVPEARPKLREALERCVEEEKPFDVEHQIDTAKGNRRWLRSVGAPSEIENGEVVKVAGAVQDITDQKEAERELAESEERYRTLAEHFPNGAVGVYDRDLRYTLVEGELLGEHLPPSERIEGSRLSDVFPESTVSDLEPMFRAAVEEGISGEAETTFEGRIWRVWATPLRNPDGEIFAGLSYAQDITEHREREKALRRQRNLLEQTQRLAGGWHVNTKTEEVSWSEEVYRIHDLPPGTEVGLEEAIGFFEPEAQEELRQAFERCFQEHEPYDLELPLTTASGERRWVRTVGAPSDVENGEVVQVSGAVQDITERKEAERALQGREAQLRGLANSIPGVVFQAFARPGRKYGFHLVSEGAEELLGISDDPDDFFVRCLERVPDSEREHVLESIDETVDAEAQLQFEAPFVKPSGETIWILGTATPERRGDELIYNGVILDITERKSAEQALKEREKYLSVTLQSIGDAVITTDRAGRIVEMNPVAERLTDWSQEEAEGERLDDVLTLHSAQTGEVVESPADEVLRVGETVGLANHTVLTSRDGTEYQIADSAAPIRSEEEDLLGVVLVFRDVTEKYERRRRMERQNDLFAKAQDLANVGGWEYDVRSGEAIWTEEVYHIHGFPPDAEVSPERSLQFYHEEDRPVIEEGFARAVEEGEPYDLELRLTTAEGGERWVRTRGEPQIVDGEVVRVRGTIQDVTDRKQYEEELEHTTDLLRLAEEMTGVGGWSLDLRGGQPYRAEWTENLYDIFGLPYEEEPPTEEVFEYYHPVDRGRHREAVDRAEQEGEGWNQELRLIRADGAERWVHNLGIPIIEEGDVIGIRGAIQDITERKERERELEETKQLLEKTLESLSEAVLVVDPSGREIVTCNSAVENIFGYSSDELVGRSTEVLHVDQESFERFGEISEPKLEEQGHYSTEYQMRRKDGVIIDTENVVTPLKGDHWPDGVVSVVRDITDRKERERELRAAKEKAERMNRLKSAFLANMSHEVRTPLTSIIGFAEIIHEEVAALEPQDTDLDLSTLSRYSNLIARGGKRLMETLEDVLDLSKLEAGEMSLSEKPVDLGEEATEVVEQFEPQVLDAGLTLQAEVPEGGIRAHADPDGLRIALRNLVNNATKYTEEGGQVWVRVRRDGDTSVVEVEDTGIGMDPERVPELFEAFVQESEGIGREYEGSGLGLTVTKKVVNQMGGSIDVETEKGEGSRFTVRLPRAEG